MAKKVKCKKCGQQVELRSMEWGNILRLHQVQTMDGKYDCPNSMVLEKDNK